MKNFPLIIWLIIAVIFSGLIVFLRIHYGNKYELKNNDFIFFGIMIFIALLLGGKLDEMEIFGIKAKLSEAGDIKIEKQISIKNIEIRSFSDINGIFIPWMIKTHTKGLKFKLGYEYKSEHLKMIFDSLHSTSYLQYLIIVDEDEKLFGIYDAVDLMSFFRTKKDDEGYKNFVYLVKNYKDKSELNSKNKGKNIYYKDLLKERPGFIGKEKAAKVGINRRDALQKMIDQQVDILPVIDDNDKFIGIIERSELNSRLILDIIN